MSLLNKPIKDIDSLLRWVDDESLHPFSRRVPLPEDYSPPDRRRLLVCHDMRGGYLHDRYSQGCDCSNVYTLPYCQLIDVFVYFSHHFITVPPAQWIDLCHMNGIPVLGTFITEGESGMNLCESSLFFDEAKATELAQAMAKLAKVCQFDGWLINVENPLSLSPIDGQRLSCLEVMSFVFLPALKKAMAANGSHILWYDAVTCYGELEWQNRLNAANETFFDICDGIFLNYNWTIDDLTVSRRNSKHRPHDVYVGLDVFARGCTGHFQTHFAMEKAAKFDLSAAIFAPGWVMECLEETKFIRNQGLFWNCINTQAVSKPVSHLPFATCFCTGRGETFHTIESGKSVKCASSWSYLPMTTWIPCDGGATVTETDAFIGGSCIELSPCERSVLIADFALFVEDIQVCVATKSGRIVITLDYTRDGADQVVMLTEHGATASRQIGSWLWRKHSIKFESQVQLKRAHAVVTSDETALLGLFTVQKPSEARDEPLSPTMYRLRQQDNRLYIIVRLHNPDCKVVNAYLHAEENQFLASSVGEYMCILFEFTDTDAEQPGSIVLAFSVWRHLMLDPIESGFEYLRLELAAGKQIGHSLCHLTDEEEQVFIEMFRSVG